MYEINNEGSLHIVGTPTYKLEPQPGATADDVLSVLALLDIRITAERYKELPEETRRHFTTNPS